MKPYRLIWQNRLSIIKFLKKLNQKSSNIYNRNKFWSEITNSVSIPENLSHTLVWMLLPRIIKKLNKMSKTNYLMIPQSGLRIRNKMREYEFINKDINLSELKKEVVKDSKKRIIGKADLEISISISALKKFKKWDSCIQLFREHRIPLTYVNLRHYFFSQQIIEALKIHKKPNLRVLEIGGGGVI